TVPVTESVDFAALHSAMMASSPVGLLVTDVAGTCVLVVNDRFCELTCLHGAAETIRDGRISLSDLREAIRLQSVDGVGARDLLRIRDAGTTRQEITLRDGRTLSFCGVEARDGAGRVLGYLW